MKINLEQKVKGLHGVIKNDFDVTKKDTDLILKDLLILVLTTEKILNDDRSGFKVVNDKSDIEKFDDYKLGMQITDKKETDLTHDQIETILKRANFLETNTFGALKMILTES